MTPLDRDSGLADALLTDLYLDALLAGAVLDLETGPGQTGERLDPAVVRATDRLRHDLIRVHPSFRFEERLATRLAETALALRVPLAVGGEGRLVPFPVRSAGAPSLTESAADWPPIDDFVDGAGPADLDPVAWRERTRPLLIGGALTSAAISLAGAAFVAWRFGRPGRTATTMARAARAVREARLAATVRPVIDPTALRRRLD